MLCLYYIKIQLFFVGAGDIVYPGSNVKGAVRMLAQKRSRRADLFRIRAGKFVEMLCDHGVKSSEMR